MHGFYCPNGRFRVVVLDECRPLTRWLVEDPEVFDIAMLRDKIPDLGDADGLVDVGNAYRSIADLLMLFGGNSIFFPRRLGRKIVVPAVARGVKLRAFEYIGRLAVTELIHELMVCELGVIGPVVAHVSTEMLMCIAE